MKELKEILQNNYKINKFIYDNISNPLFKIEYVKNNETKNIEIVETSEKLVEDIRKLYNINIFTIHNSINVKVNISGYNFTDVKLIKYENIIEGNEIRTKLIFEIDPNLNNLNKRFYGVDFRESIEIFISEKLIFSGFITHIRLDKAPFSIFHVYCEDLFCILELSKVDDLFFYQNGSLKEFIKLYYDIKDLEILENGLDVQTNKRVFRIIIPLKGLNIKEKLNLGKCIILPNLSELNLDDGSDFLNSFNCFVLLELKGTSFYEAYRNGSKIIRTAINILNFRIKIPNYFDGYDYYDQNSTVDLADYFYIQDFENNSTVIISDINSKRPTFEKDYLFYYLFRPIIGLANKYIDPELILSKKEQKRREKEMLILSYLNSAEKKVNENRNAAFLDLWISIELLVSRFKPKFSKIFQDNDSERIEKNLKRIFEPKFGEIEKKENEGIITLEEKEKLNKELKLKKNQIRSEFYRTPLNKELEILLGKYNLSLSAQEKEIYKEARQKRNDIIHANEISIVSRKEYNLISKIIYLILKEEFFKLIKEERKKDFRFENPIVPIYFRMIIDHLIIGLNDKFKNDMKLTKLKELIKKLTNLGMPSPKDLIPEYKEPSALIINPQESDKIIKLLPVFLIGSIFLRKKDPRIPPLFDEIIEKLGEFLVIKYGQNEKINFAYELVKFPHFIGDLDIYYRTFLNNIIWGLCELEPENEFFKEVQNDLNWLDKSGIQSYNVREAMKGIERWQKKKKSKQ